MNKERIKLFNKVLKKSKEELSMDPRHIILPHIIAILEYLIAVESGEEHDHTKLFKISRDGIPVREIDNLNPDLSSLVYKIISESKMMASEKR